MTIKSNRKIIENQKEVKKELNKRIKLTKKRKY
jgi:hypothetical protein